MKEWDPVQFGSVTFNPDMWTSTGGSHGQKNAMAKKNHSEKITDSSKFDDKFDYPPEDLTTISKQSEEEIDEEEMDDEDLEQESIPI